MVSEQKAGLSLSDVETISGWWGVDVSVLGKRPQGRGTQCLRRQGSCSGPVDPQTLSFLVSNCTQQVKSGDRAPVVRAWKIQWKEFLTRK